MDLLVAVVGRPFERAKMIGRCTAGPRSITVGAYPHVLKAPCVKLDAAEMLNI